MTHGTDESVTRTNKNGFNSRQFSFISMLELISIINLMLKKKRNVRGGAAKELTRWSL